MGLLFLNLLTYADTVNKNEENHYEQNLVFCPEIRGHSL